MPRRVPSAVVTDGVHSDTRGATRSCIRDVDAPTEVDGDVPVDLRRSSVVCMRYDSPRAPRPGRSLKAQRWRTGTQAAHHRLHASPRVHWRSCRPSQLSPLHHVTDFSVLQRPQPASSRCRRGSRCARPQLPPCCRCDPKRVLALWQRRPDVMAAP